jgi:hypothetical protein
MATFAVGRHHAERVRETARRQRAAGWAFIRTLAPSDGLRVDWRSGQRSARSVGLRLRLRELISQLCDGGITATSAFEILMFHSNA